MPPKKDKEDMILSAIGNLAEATGKRFDNVDSQLFGIRSEIEDIKSLLIRDLDRRVGAVERKLGIR